MASPVLALTAAQAARIIATRFENVNYKSACTRKKQTPGAGRPLTGDLNEIDKKLVKLALGGDTDAFGELVDTYWEKITALIYQKLGRFPEVEDIVQETFIKAFNCLHQLRKPGNFAAWLYQIASKLCIDHLRSRKKKSISLDAMQEKDLQFENGQQEYSPSDLFSEIMEIVGSLPEIYRVVVTLRFLEGMSCKEIAQHMDEPQGTIRNRLFRANEILRRRLAKAVREYSIPGVGEGEEDKKNNKTNSNSDTGV
jgi:RNA polymerase sigma-70 factor (ECF subfamily)